MGDWQLGIWALVILALTAVYFGTATPGRSRGVQLAAVLVTAVTAGVAVEATINGRNWPMLGQFALPWWAGTYLVNGVLTFFVYGYDKRAAGGKRWRVNSRTLWWLQLSGGWPGALLGQRFFDHKTSWRREFGFKMITWAMIAANVAFWIWLTNRAAG